MYYVVRLSKVKCNCKWQLVKVQNKVQLESGVGGYKLKTGFPFWGRVGWGVDFD